MPAKGTSSSIKLTDAQVAEIRTLYDRQAWGNGVKGERHPYAKLTAVFGVNPSAISSIQLRKTWKHLP
jgi:hypothetical protein